MFLDTCREKGIAPAKQKSAKFVIRLKPEIHKLVVMQDISLNEWANRALQTALRESLIGLFWGGLVR